MAKKPPYVPGELLEWLEETFPDQAPRHELSQFMFGTKAGEQRVIQRLRREHNKQQDNIVEA